MGFVNMTKHNEGTRIVEKMYRNFIDSKVIFRLKIFAQSEYYQLMANSIKNFKKNCASTEDIENLEDFYLRIYLTNRALSIRDEKGFFPANYFVFMPIPLYLIKKTLKDFSGCGFLNGKDEKAFNELSHKLTYQAGIFSPSFLTTAEMRINTRLPLENKFKVKSTKQDGTINFDLSSDEKFEEFLDKMSRIIEKYNLPNTETCCIILGNDIVRGRNPINLKGLEAEVEKERG